MLHTKGDNMVKWLKTGLCFVCLLILTVPVCAYSVTIVLEAEIFANSHDIALGPIQSLQGASCTGGYYLSGFDYSDEWVEYNFDVTDFGYYTIQVRVRGEYQVNFWFEATLTGHPSGDTQTTYIPFTGKDFG
jgi:hypothetical protein